MKMVGLLYLNLKGSFAEGDAMKKKIKFRETNNSGAGIKARPNNKIWVVQKLWILEIAS